MKGEQTEKKSNIFFLSAKYYPLCLCFYSVLLPFFHLFSVLFPFLCLSYLFTYVSLRLSFLILNNLTIFLLFFSFSSFSFPCIVSFCFFPPCPFVSFTCLRIRKRGSRGLTMLFVGMKGGQGRGCKGESKSRRGLDGR